MSEHLGEGAAAIHGLYAQQALILTELRAARSAVADTESLNARLIALEKEHESWKTLAKYLSITVSLIGAILSFIGYQWLETKLRAEADQRFSFYSNLAAGLTYLDRFPESAIPHLMRAFDERPHEETVVNAILAACDQADDWDTGRVVVNRLATGSMNLTAFRDPLTYNLIAASAVNALMLSETDRPTMSSVAQRAIDRGLRLAGEGSEALWWLHLNAWRNALVFGKEAEARREVERLILHRTPPTFVPWDRARSYTWYQKVIDLRLIDASKIEEMYRKIEIGYRGN